MLPRRYISICPKGTFKIKEIRDNQFTFHMVTFEDLCHNVKYSMGLVKIHGIWV
jgi:hypothetical protein